MDLESILRNKRVCVLMTCNKPQYVERRLKNESTYKHIQDAGFVFFYLISDPDAGAEIRVTFDEISGRYSMYVPLEETYDNLVHKMIAAYEFLISIQSVEY